MVAKLLALVLPLGLDTFAVAAALGLAGGQSRLRIPLLFSAFEAAMPLVGVALGAPLGHTIGGAAEYVAIGVLLTFGLHTLVASDARDEERLAALSRTRGRGALVLGLSVSLDELAIGFTLGLLRIPATLVIVLIAAQAFIAAQLGLALGNHLSARLREAAERLAGATLIGLAVALLVAKLLS